MSKFKGGDETYTIDFKMLRHKLLEKIGALDAKMIDSRSFTSSGVFHTKNEAIDATIKQLEELKQ